MIRSSLKFVLIPALLSLLVAPACADKFVAQVVGVPDGDTLVLRRGAKRHFQLNLNRIDAPEIDQPFGKIARDMLAKMVLGREVNVATKVLDRRSGHGVAEIWVDAQSTNTMLLRNGLAWIDPKQPSTAWDKANWVNEADMHYSEKQARAEKRGLKSAGCGLTRIRFHPGNGASKRTKPTGRHFP